MTVPSALGRGKRLRAMCAVLVGAYLVHQLRYFFAYGSGATDALAEQGHAYLAQIVCPLIGSLLALSMGQLMWSLTRPERASRRRPNRTTLAAAAAAVLLTVYSAQELLEGALAAGHPVGLDGVIGAGGWIAMPLALAFGLVIALVLEGVETVAEHARVRMRLTVVLPVALTPAVPAPAGILRAVDLRIGRHIAGRAPPLLSL